MNRDILSKLEPWGIEAIDIKPLIMRENAVYKIFSKTDSYFLKIARIGFRSLSDKYNEINLLNYLNQHHFKTTEPVPTLDGHFVVEYDDGIATLTRGIDAIPFEEVMCEQKFFELGKMMANFHQLTRRWQVPKSYSRPKWDKEGLLGERPHWGKFWANPILNKKEKQWFLAFREYAYNHFPDSQLQIIHADLVKENVLFDGEKLIFIDFDDMSLGNIHFEMATALIKNDHNAEYQQWRTALLDGYGLNETVNLEQLELFMAIRAVSYLGWIMNHPLLDVDGQKSKLYRTQALKYIQHYL